MRARLITHFNYNDKTKSVFIHGKYIKYEFLNVNIKSIVSEPRTGFSTFTCNEEVSFHINFNSKIIIIKNAGMVMDIMNLNDKSLSFFSSI